MLMEFKKGINYKFIISIFSITLILLGEVYNYNTGNIPMYSEANAIHCFLNAIFSKVRTLVPLILILGGWIYSDTLHKEWKSGYLRFISVRLNFKSYLKKKFIVNFIISYLIVFIPLLILFIVSRVLFQNNLEVLDSTRYYNVQGVLQQFYINYPDLYMILSILISGIPFALFSTLGISASFVIHSRIIIITLPFIFYSLLDLLIGIFRIDIATPEIILSWIRIELNKSIFIILSLVLVLILFLLKKTKEKGVII